MATLGIRRGRAKVDALRGPLLSSLPESISSLRTPWLADAPDPASRKAAVSPCAGVYRPPLSGAAPHARSSLPARR